MYVVILALIAATAGLALFHWAMHTYGYGVAGVGAAGVIGLLVLVARGRR